MKKVLLVLLLLVTFGFIGIQTFAEEAETGNLVIHFKAWDEDYTELGSWAWGGPAAGKVYDGLDDFGAYWEYNNIPVGTSVGFIAVRWPGGAGPNWDDKLTGDVNISADAVVAGQTTHVYVFEGAATNATNPAHFIASNDKPNMLVIYFDPSGSYEENLGVHTWGWANAAPGWGDPFPMTNAGKTAANIDVKGIMLYADEDWAGLLVYAGEDANKKTGDVTLAGSGASAPGEVGIAYIVSKGDSYLAGDNVYYNDFEAFAEDAFTFKLMPFKPEDMEGTYAVDPYTIIVKTSAPIASPYPTATDKDAARATIESWFSVKEVGQTTPLTIERVDFATSNTTLNQFVVVLGEALNKDKEYEIFFDLGIPEPLEVAKEVQVTLNVTVPANTPAGELPVAAGSFSGWNPENVAYQTTQVGDTLVYTLTFTVEVKNPYTAFEYKWTRGSWSTEEFIASNRTLLVANYVDSVVLDDVVIAWADVDAPEEKYPAPVVEVPEVGQNIKASLALDLDKEAPVIQFISPTGIVGKPANQRIIEVAWGQPFNQNSFPRFRATDNRDGDLTPFVFVPKGQYSVLDTRTEGDYIIMLEVTDTWGNVTQETFIFRVIKR